ncbi:Acyl transferase [Apiospora sp. TS-2023a]
MVVTQREPRQEEHAIRPTGWENDPEEERFRLSLFDPIILVVYCQFALYFRLDDAHRDQAAQVLQQGLERTLSQVRHLCGTIEKDEGGGFSFVKKRDTTVRYVVKWLDGPEYPSIDDLESNTFSYKSLGADPGAFALDGMPYGEGLAVSNPNNSPITSGFQLNFVRGGAMFSSHLHHWAADLVGWRNFTRQLSDNCRAIWDARANGGLPQWPSWDPACIDVSRFTKQLPADQLVDGPPVAPRHKDLPPQDQFEAVLFHLPKSKAAALKKLAQPKEGEGWVSTYDAMCAFVWRHLTRVRAPYYGADPSATAPWFGESVDMRGRFHNPDPPQRMIRNMLTGGFSEMAPAHVQLPTVGELGSLPGHETPLSHVAMYVRRLTDSVTQEMVEGVLEYIATLRDQQSISFNLMAKPPLSLFITDHRPADSTASDFGFGRPLTHRFLTGDGVSANLAFVYPPSASTGGDDDQGTIWSIGMERDLVPKLRADPEWSQYFEYRGVD